MNYKTTALCKRWREEFNTRRDLNFLVSGSWCQLTEDEINTPRKRKKVRQRKNWARVWRDKRIGRADFLSPIKATTPQCCYGDLLSLPSFQRATTYPRCLSVSRACGCVCFCVLAPEWIKQMKGKAIRGPSQTRTHMHTQRCIHTHTHTHN